MMPTEPTYTVSVPLQQTLEAERVAYANHRTHRAHNTF